MAHRTPNHGTVQTGRVAPPSPLPCARTLFCDESNANADHLASGHTGTDSGSHCVSTSTADTVSMRSCSTEDNSSFDQSSVCSMEADSSPAGDLDSDMDAYLSSTASNKASMSSDTSGPVVTVTGSRIVTPQSAIGSCAPMMTHPQNTKRLGRRPPPTTATIPIAFTMPFEPHRAPGGEETYSGGVRGARSSLARPVCECPSWRDEPFIPACCHMCTGVTTGPPPPVVRVG